MQEGQQPNLHYVQTHPSPVYPGSQTQVPSSGWQELGQLQVREQFCPYLPGGQGESQSAPKKEANRIGDFSVSYL